MLLYWILNYFSEYKDSFDMFDLDRDGLISKKELALMLEKLGQKADAGEVDRLMAAADLNSELYI